MRRIAAFVAVLVVGCGGSTSDGGTATPAASDTGVDGSTVATDTGDELAPEASADTASGDVATATDTAATTCITSVSEGTRSFTCDGFVYDVTVPAACVAGGCGLVLDVHGMTMSGKMEDNNTNMRALGAKYGYVVVQPNANPAPPSSSWNPPGDDDKVFAFLQLALATYAIDPKRVHMTGFSQGGMMSSRFLCHHADVFASIAPAAGTGCTFTGKDAPSRELPVLYMHGKTDALVAFSAGTAQRDAALAYWKMTKDAVLETDAHHTWTRFKSPSGTVFEFIEHDYEASSFVLKGHCYPGSKDLKGGEPGQLFGFACTDAAAFTWGDVAMKFFVDHPKS